MGTAWAKGGLWSPVGEMAHQVTLVNDVVKEWSSHTEPVAHLDEISVRVVGHKVKRKQSDKILLAGVYCFFSNSFSSSSAIFRRSGLLLNSRTFLKSAMALPFSPLSL